MQKTLFGNLRYIQVSQFDCAILSQEYVRTLDVSVENFQIMKCFHSANNLNEVVPYFLLREMSVLLLVIINELHHVTAICVLHDNTQGGRRVLKKCLFVADNVLMLDGGKDADLV